MIQILVGDVRDRLAELPDGSVQCVVTSPPYFGLRDYGVANQIGLEPTLADYLTTMVDVFRDVRRVLRSDGTCWLNCGDSYASGSPCDRRNVIGNGSPDESMQRRSRLQGGLKEKDLMMVPARLAIALQDDGWWLRSDIIWAKKNCMPESVTDRPTSAHEHIFLLTKAARYFYDAEAVREGSVSDHPSGNGYKRDARLSYDGRGQDQQWQVSAHRNLRNVWHLATEPFPDAHFATFPTEIPRRCIKAGTSEKGCCAACGAPWARVVERELLEFKERKDYPSSIVRSVKLGYDGGVPKANHYTTGWQPGCTCAAETRPCVVLDPFLGSGTTLLVADQLGRDGIGIELNAEYAAMAEDRIRGSAPMFTDVALSATAAGR